MNRKIIFGLQNLKRFGLLMIMLTLSLRCHTSQQSSSAILNDGKKEVKEERPKFKTGTKIGEKAPEIIMQNPEGDTITLSSLKGKMVLVDFWASWCAPCRIKSPDLVRIYYKYKNAAFSNGNGFSIFSISLDKDQEKWVNAIDKDRLNWETHGCDLMGWYTQSVLEYNVLKIPNYYLLNDEGVILDKDLGIDELESVLDSYLK